MKLLSTLALMGAMYQLTSRYEDSAAIKIATDFGPTNALVSRIKSGEVADAAILTEQAVDELTRDGTLATGSRVDIALSFVGLAVKAGAPKPEIGSVEACKRALLDAKSIGYSRIGASGVFFADLIKRLGIADEVNAKAKIIPSGLTAELAASGEVELAVQQVSELMVVPGIDVIGRFPPDIQSSGAMFSGGVFARSEQREAASHFLRFLSSPEVIAVLRATGLEPVNRD